MLDGGRPPEPELWSERHDLDAISSPIRPSFGHRLEARGGGRWPRTLTSGTWLEWTAPRRAGHDAVPARATVYHPRVSLTGKRVLITGGAGFIGTTLARRLVGANEVIAVDNLHRNALAGTELDERPELSLRRGRCPRPRAADRAGRGLHAHRPCGRDRRGRHGPPEPGAHDAGERHRHLQRARGSRDDARHARAPRRVLDERGVRPARLQRPGGPGHVDRVGRRGAVDVRRLEARRRAHVPRVPRRARRPGRLRAAVQHLRARSDRRRCDPRLHRGCARRRRSRDPRRRVADPRLVLRRRHGRGAPPRARASGSGRGELQRRQRALGRDDLRPRDTGQAPHRMPRRDPLRAARVHGRRVADPEHPEGPHAARLRGAVELDEGLERTIAWYRARLGAPA